MGQPWDWVPELYGDVQGSAVGYTHPKNLQHEPLTLQGAAWSSGCS